MRPKFIRAQRIDQNTVKLRWLVDNLIAAMAAWESVRVHQSSTETGTYVLVTGSETSLVEDGYEYEYTVSGTDAADKWYKLAFYESVGPSDGDFTVAIRGNGGGNYVTVEEARTAGFSVFSYPSNDVVLRAIRDAEAYLERITGQKFYPRYGAPVLRVDGNGSSILPLPEPIIAIEEIRLRSARAELETLYGTANVEAVRLTNRHLTMGSTSLGELVSPSMTYDLVYDSGVAVPLSTWPEGEQNVEIDGWIGYTELALDDPIGETSAGSQWPLSFGEPPRLVKRAVLVLLPRFLANPGDSDAMDDATQRHRVIEYKSRHQSVKYQPSTGGAGGGKTGDRIVDEWLELFSGTIEVEFA